MEVLVRPAAGGDGVYWLWSLLRGVLVPYPDGGDSAAPAVVLKRHGREYLFQRTRSTRHAERVAARLRHEVEDLGDEAFAARYGLPDFLFD